LICHLCIYPTDNTKQTLGYVGYVKRRRPTPPNGSRMMSSPRFQIELRGRVILTSELHLLTSKTDRFISSRMDHRDNLQQNWFVRFQNVVFTSLVTDELTTDRSTTFRGLVAKMKRQNTQHIMRPGLNWRRHNKNLVIANRSRVSCAHNTSRASMITP